MTKPAAGVATAALVLTLLTIGPVAADQTVGHGPLEAILSAAETYHDACPTPANRLTVAQLAALVLAPTFPETGAPPDRAPSPMTLSRYDNQAALHSYGDPSNYPRVFWHPGVGAWQWDDASRRGFAASQRINSTFIAEYTTAFIADRWCTDPRFATVWAPWHGCNGGTCKEIHDRLLGPGGELTGLVRDSAVTRRGGMRAHDCTLGTAETFRCWYVDPERAQGYAGFAQPSWGVSPITAPFLEFRTASREHRHWLRADTGYGRDIRASLELGRDSRDGLAWSSGSDLCDLTRAVGACDPLPPSGFDLQLEAISGDYQPLAGDFDGDGLDDILWYGPGDGYDSLWRGRPDGYAPKRVNVKGRYVPMVGDFDGDGIDDIFWYGPGDDHDSRWYGTPDGFEHASTRVRGTYLPVVGDFDGDGRDDVYWYGPGAAYDSLWPGAPGRRFANRVDVEVLGTYTPLPGDFDGDGHGDVFWYGPGGAPDRVSYGIDRGSFETVETGVTGTYEPATGDLDGDGRSDVLWYREGEGRDSLWFGEGRGDFRVQLPRPRITGAFRVFTGDFDGSGNDEVFFHRPGSAYDALWRLRD